LLPSEAAEFPIERIPSQTANYQVCLASSLLVQCFAGEPFGAAISAKAPTVYRKIAMTLSSLAGPKSLMGQKPTLAASKHHVRCYLNNGPGEDEEVRRSNVKEYRGATLSTHGVGRAFDAVGNVPSARAR
jgi:hypothetical protein